MKAAGTTSISVALRSIVVATLGLVRLCQINCNTCSMPLKPGD